MSRARRPGGMTLPRGHCDGPVKIPLPGDIESVNARIDAGVALFDAARQRQ